jgi:hypothetical protein
MSSGQSLFQKGRARLLPSRLHLVNPARQEPRPPKHRPYGTDSQRNREPIRPWREGPGVQRSKPSAARRTQPSMASTFGVGKRSGMQKLATPRTATDAATECHSVPQRPCARDQERKVKPQGQAARRTQPTTASTFANRKRSRSAKVRHATQADRRCHSVPLGTHRYPRLGPGCAFTLPPRRLCNGALVGLVKTVLTPDPFLSVNGSSRSEHSPVASDLMTNDSSAQASASK